jgi:hypothetical protein
MAAAGGDGDGCMECGFAVLGAIVHLCKIKFREDGKKYEGKYKS